MDASTANGKTNYAKIILETLAKEYSVFSKVIDTSDFGVAQKRHRFFVVALRKDAFRTGVEPFEIIEQERQSFLRRKGIPSAPISAKMALSDLELRRNGKIASRDSRGFEDISYNGPLSSYQAILNRGHNGLLPNTRLARHRPEIEARFRKIIDLCHADGRLNVSLSAELRQVSV